MENIEKIKHANEHVERYEKITKLEKELSQSGKLEQLVFPGYSSLDKESRVYIPYFLRDVLKRVIKNALEECGELELGVIKQIQIEGTQKPIDLL